MKVLSRYTKSKDVTNIENVTQTDYLKQLAIDAQNASAPDDYQNPYTYEQWYNRNLGIISGQERQQYETYLKNWYNNRYTPTIVTEDLKQDYISFLQNLTLVLNKEDKTNWLVCINWDDELEVEQTIPYFAKKLREIAIYLVNKRDALKRAKLKYNTNGANQAIERLFYEYLLKAFTKRNYVMNVPEEETYNTFPALSSVKDGFQIIVEELYDDTSYFDKNPTLSASYYYDTTNPDITAYYESLGANVSTYEWLFRTGFSQLCADNPLFWIVGNIVTSELPLSAFISNDNLILNEYYKFKLAQKYIGENQYFVSGGYYTAWEKEYTYNLINGNNWFYWPSGEVLDEVETSTLDPIRLVSTSLIESGATGAKNYLSADKIFIKYDNVVSGAWLKTIVETTETTIMCAGLNGGVNQFKYPFPGYGTSGEDLDWSGKQLSNLDHEFDFLNEEVQKEIETNYWTTNTTTSSLCTILLNDTQLVENGANAGRLYNEADHITIRVTDNIDKVHDTNPDGVYQGEFQHAWLYKIQTTDIPIGRQQNYINWPLSRYTNTDTTLINILTSQCAPVALTSLPTSAFIGARAGYNLYDSDIIYKLDARSGTPIECAFLSGQTMDGCGGMTATFTAAATGIIQNALCLNCKAGQYTTFIWTDDDIEVNETTIKNVRHQPDCMYLYTDHHSLYTENPADKKSDINYRQWQECDCRAISYSPLGHPGSVYDDYKGMADVIFLDTLYPLPFTPLIWVGLDGENYLNSEDFAWFKLNGPDVEPDVGWGAGQWVAGGIPNAGRKFILKKGQQYKYLRASLGHDKTYLTDGTVPYLIVKHPYQNTPSQQWIRAIVDTAGNWQTNNVPSDMIIRAGDYLVYDHIESNWYCITSVGDLGESITYNTSALLNNESVWQTYNYVTTGIEIEFLWPNILSQNGPNVLSFQLSSVTWYIQAPSESVSAYVIEQIDTPLTIAPWKTGTWTVTAIGDKTKNSGNNYYISDGSAIYPNVGDFTVSPVLSTYDLSGSNNINTIYTDTINMTINAPLYGWNYANYVYDGVSYGGRPFWAYASDKDDKITKHKGIDVWGGGIRIVDDYTLLTQPEPSNIELGLDTFIEYTANNDFIWIEPLTLNVNKTSNNWNELIIDTTRIASLSDFLYNINQELIVSATDRPSEIVLLPKLNESQVFVNYWAINPFQWTQVVTNSSLGLPPTGGVLVPITTGLLIEALYPYANLTNRHFPTIASVPHVEDLYTVKNSGGYFIPRMFGVTTALAKNVTNLLNGYKIPNNGEGTNAFLPITNPLIYTRDRSLSQSDQNLPIENQEIDSIWMKSPVTTWKKSGMIVEAARHQQFIPYKTRYETTGENNAGIHQQQDAYDPWNGVLDDTWENPTDYPPNFIKEYNITDWYNKFSSTDKQVYQWKTDIYGNQYALLKMDFANKSNYEKKHLINGEVWVRNSRNVVEPLSTMISDIFTDVSAVVLYNNILDMDIFYDTLMFYTSSELFLYKLTMDYDTSEITTNIATNAQIILSANVDEKFGGTWLSDDKKVTICTLLSSNDQIRPILREFNLNTNDLLSLYSVSALETNMSTYSLTAYDHPVFTYNKSQNVYNVSYIAHGSNKVGMYLTTINITNSGGNFVINNAKTIVPDN